MLPALSLASLPRPAAADPAVRPIVVELFTSQGCSSCPPADAFLREQLADDADVLALSYFIDYWDYLGWKDTLARPSNADRQQAYARNLGLKGVYTPQIVVDGKIDVIGSRTKEVDDAIDSRARSAPAVPIDITEQDTSWQIHLDADPEFPTEEEATVWLVRYTKQVEVDIERGENRGHVFDYANVVRDLSPIGVYKGGAVDIELRKPDVMSATMDACAIFVQRNGTGAIVGAVKLADAAKP